MKRFQGAAYVVGSVAVLIVWGFYGSRVGMLRALVDFAGVAMLMGVFYLGVLNILRGLGKRKLMKMRTFRLLMDRGWEMTGEVLHDRYLEFRQGGRHVYIDVKRDQIKTGIEIDVLTN